MRSIGRRYALTPPLVLLLAAALVLSGPVGCLTTEVAPLGAETAGGLEKDEARLWKQAEEEERQLRGKATIYDDPLLNDYLNGVAQRLVPPEVKAQGLLKVRVYAIEDPSLNAFTYPTGSVYVHTGLLARMENEAQLATVLGHEIAHATNRHTLRFDRSARNKALGFSIASIAASVAIAGAAGHQADQGDWEEAYVLNQVGNIMVGLGLQLGFMAAVNGYGRDLEREADEVGLQRLAAAGYDPRQAPRVFELLKDDRGDGSKLEVFFFGSHPRLQERVDATQQIVAARYAGAGPTTQPADPKEFARRTRVLVRDNAALDLEAGRLGNAEAGIRKVLEMTPNDPVAHFLQGRLFEKRAALAKAEEARPLNDQAILKYREAVRLDPRYPDPLRALGILSYRLGDKSAARDAFRRYLDLRPDAPDARQVKDYLLELQAP